MNTMKRILYFLMFLPFFIIIIALFFLPDQIPIHYDINFEVTRWGSKYEMLSFPIITILFGGFMLALATHCAKQEENGKNNAKIAMIAGIVCLVLFNVMTCYFLYTAFHLVNDLSTMPIDIYQLITALFGIGFLILGNLSPKIRPNQLIGLRTKWSLKNEQTWKASQRFAGIIMMIDGVCMLLSSCFFHGLSSLLSFIIIIFVSLLIEIYYSYRIAKKF